MTEPTMTPPEIVRAVYDALISVDPDTIRAAACRYFADDIVVHEPESLPWGGVYRGRELVTGLMANIGDPASPIAAAHLSVDRLVHTAFEDGSHEVIAAVSFPFRGPERRIPMQALEWLTVRDSKVTEIRVYLWDTAAGLAVLKPAEASEVDS